MITIEALKELGCDTDDALTRCLNNEAFYLKLVNMSLEDEKFVLLRKAVEEKRLKEGFEYAHALKGMLANISLIIVLEPVLEITEGLRHEEDRDYSALLDKMDSELERVKALRD